VQHIDAVPTVRVSGLWSTVRPSMWRRLFLGLGRPSFQAGAFRPWRRSSG